MSSISATGSNQYAYTSPLQQLDAELQSEVSAGTISSSDETALSSALTSINDSLTSGQSSSSSSSSTSSSGDTGPGDIKSKITSLIQAQVSSGALTSSQATELQNLFTNTFANGPGRSGWIWWPRRSWWTRWRRWTTARPPSGRRSIGERRFIVVVVFEQPGVGNRAVDRQQLVVFKFEQLVVEQQFVVRQQQLVEQRPARLLEIAPGCSVLLVRSQRRCDSVQFKLVGAVQLSGLILRKDAHRSKDTWPVATATSPSCKEREENRQSVRRKTVQQPVAAGALEIGLRTAAIRAARGMRRVPGF